MSPASPLEPALELRDGAGRLLVSARVAAERVALEPAPGAHPPAAAAAVLAAFPRRTLRTDDAALAHALVAAGATAVRAADALELLLPGPRPAPGPPPADIRLRPLDGPPERYAPLLHRAYPPAHPDHEPGDATLAGAAATVDAYLHGASPGPFIADPSAEAVAADGALVGAILLCRVAGDRDADGGPWVTELVVDPSWHGRGIGGALLDHAAARLAAAGETRLGLSVHVDNPARELYVRRGFRYVRTTWTLASPRR